MHCYYQETKAITPDSIGKLAVVEVDNSGVFCLRVPVRGYSSGFFNLKSISGAVIQENVRLTRVYPVLLMKI